MLSGATIFEVSYGIYWPVMSRYSVPSSGVSISGIGCVSATWLNNRGGYGADYGYRDAGV